MNERIVIRLNRVGGVPFAELERSPLRIAGQDDPEPVEIPVWAGDADACVKGAALMTMLLSSNSVGAAINHALSRPITSEPLPLYFRVSGPEDALPWEQIYADSAGFCALDNRWPVGRIARSDEELGSRIYDPPVRIVAVISAAKRSGLKQLNMLIALAQSESAKAIGVSLHVISGQTEIVERAEAAAADNITVEPMAADEASGIHQIENARPQILHVLGHGGTVANVRVLNLVNPLDEANDEDIGSINLKVPNLSTAVSPSWLIVLAACDSADASEGPAMARDMVLAGAPAVIGMRRPVNLSDADRMCAELYPQLLKKLSIGLSSRPDDAITTYIDWASILTSARNAIGGPNPSLVETWSDLVLYSHPSTMSVFHVPASALSAAEFTDLTAQKSEWVALRNGIASRAPARLLDEIDANIATLDGQLSARPA